MAKKRPSKRVGPRVTKTRHAPDGSEVPLESDGGLTVHVVTQWPGRLPANATPEQAERFVAGLRDFDETRPTAERILGDVERQAQRVLAAAGLPSTWTPLEIRCDGTWQPLGGGLLEPRPGVRHGYVTALVEDQPQTPEWFAAELLAAIYACRRALDPPPPLPGKAPRPVAQVADEAARTMWWVAHLYHLARFKGEPEGDAIRGARQPRHGKLGAEARAATYRDRDEVLTAEWRRIREESPHFDKLAISQELVSRYPSLGLSGRPPSANPPEQDRPPRLSCSPFRLQTGAHMGFLGTHDGRRPLRSMARS